MLFKKSKELEVQVSLYLDNILQSILHFNKGVKHYFDDNLDDLEERIETLNDIKLIAEEQKREIKTKLYLYTLIPESRGDVLDLLDSSFKVLSSTHHTLLEFSVERPLFLQELHEIYIDLSKNSTKAAEHLVYAIRNYFENFNAVRDNINKVIFYENETDRIAEKIKRIVFSKNNISLSEKIHMRYFALHIENISDEAEKVSDRLAIATIKRHV